MRAVVLLVVFALLALHVSAVSVPFKSCGKSSDDATIDSIESNEFPPVKGDTLSFNVTGNLSKEVTSGTYSIAVTVSNFPLPTITGDIGAFRPLPWPVGDLNVTYSQAIPSAAPSGSYVVKISAVDQDSTQIFCISIAFSLKAEEGDSDKAVVEMSEQQQRMVDQLPIQTIRRLAPIASNLQRIKTDMRLPLMKPVKKINRKL